MTRRAVVFYDEQAETRARQIAQAHGWLRPDGTFIWTTPNEPPNSLAPGFHDPDDDSGEATR